MNDVAPPKGWENSLQIGSGATVANPFTGQTCELSPVALAVYDVIKGAEAMASIQDKMAGEPGVSDFWKDVRKGLDWFRKNYPSEYMILLD